MIQELQKSYGVESQQRTLSLFHFSQMMAILSVLTRTILFLSRIQGVEMVRKYIRKATVTLHKDQMLILFHIASLEDWIIVTQTNVSKVLNKPISSLNYHFTKLKKKGLLDKWNSLTSKGKRVLRYLKHWDKTFDKMLRAHKIQVTLFLSKVPESLQSIKNTVLTPFNNKRYKGLKLELMGCHIMFYGANKAVAVLPDIYGNNDEEISAALCDTIEQLTKVLEDEFKGLKVDEYKPAKFSSMHVAILDSIIADLFLLEKQRCYSNGRIAVDGSHGRSELEAENGNTALEDIEALVKYEDLARENKVLKERVNEVESLLENLRKNEVKESTS